MSTNIFTRVYVAYERVYLYVYYWETRKMWTQFRRRESKEGRFEYPNVDGRIILK